MAADIEVAFLKERMRDIRSRLARADRLGLHELNSLKSEYEAIQKIVKAKSQA